MAQKTESKRTTTDVPQLFRLNVEVSNLDEAAAGYGQLFELTGRRQAGARVYFDCGPVALQVLQVETPHPVPKALYFTVKDVDAVFARARALGWLSPMKVHGEPGGEVVVRPWGERSFYADDPWGNQLCFVEDGTVYAG
jgi:hypothetical protein